MLIRKNMLKCTANTHMPKLLLTSKAFNSTGMWKFMKITLDCDYSILDFEQNVH